MITESRDLWVVIDYYISHLQVAGYKVTINNHNIGDYHNITITQTVAIRRRWWWFGAPDTLYEREIVYAYAIQLPKNGATLIRLFECYLSKTSVQWEPMEFNV